MSRDSNDPERDAEHWRKLEAEALTLAVGMIDPEPRRIMRFIAAGYRLLAERAFHPLQVGKAGGKLTNNQSATSARTRRSRGRGRLRGVGDAPLWARQRQSR